MGGDEDKNGDEDGRHKRKRRHESGGHHHRHKKGKHHHHHHHHDPDETSTDETRNSSTSGHTHHRIRIKTRHRVRRRRSHSNEPNKTDGEANDPEEKSKGQSTKEDENEVSDDTGPETSKLIKVRKKRFDRVRKADKPKPTRGGSIESIGAATPTKVRTEEETLRLKAKIEKLKVDLQERQEDELKAAETLHYTEQGGIPIGKRLLLGHNFLLTLRPVVLIGRIMGRYPFLHEDLHDGSIRFHVKKFHPFNIYFNLVNVLMTLLLCAGIWSYFSFNMNLPVGPQWKSRTPSNKTAKRAHLRNLRGRPERLIFDRHVVYFIHTWASILHSVLSGWHFTVRSQYIANYLTFWTKALVTINMDVTKGVLRPVVILLLAHGLAILIFIILTLINGVPSAVGAPAILAIVIGRDYNEHLLDYKDSTKKALNFSFIALTYITRPIAVYLFMASKIFLLLFIIVCKLLRNVFSTWNGCVYATVLKGGDYVNTKEGRTTYSLLFKDHCALLDLVEATDKVFSFVLETYIGLQSLSFCFEIYFLVHCARAVNNEGVAEQNGFYLRNLDIVSAVLYLVIHSILFYIVLRSSASVTDEAMAGLEVIRRKTMLGRKTDEELYFMLSMFSSYTSFKPLGICAGGFFLCSKEFNIGVLMNVISYFTLIVQFQPRFDFQREPYEKPREEIQNFLNVFEKPVYS